MQIEFTKEQSDKLVTVFNYLKDKEQIGIETSIDDWVRIVMGNVVMRIQAEQVTKDFAANAEG